MSPMASHDLPWLPIVSHDFPYPLMVSHIPPWIPLTSYGFPWLSGDAVIHFAVPLCRVGVMMRLVQVIEQHPS